MKNLHNIHFTTLSTKYTLERSFNNSILLKLLLLDVSVLCPGGGGDDAGLSSSVGVPQVTHARHRVAQRLQLPRHQLLNLQWDSCSGAELEGTVISYY